MKKQTVIAACLLLSFTAPVSAQLVERDPNDPDPPSVINDAGRIIGSDDQDLRPDAREAKNFTNVAATVIQEFAGVNTRRARNYLNFFFGLFRRKRSEEENAPTDPPTIETEDGIILGSDGQDDLFSGTGVEDTIGAAGIPDPDQVDALVAERIAVPEQGTGAFAIANTFVVDAFSKAATLQISKDTNDLGLSEEAQQLTAEQAENLADAVEASNQISDEAEEAKATQDAIKMQSKQLALQAAISEINAQENQQQRLATLQGNRALFEVQDLMLQQEWRRTVDNAAGRVAVLKSVHNFSGAFRTRGEEAAE